MFRNLRWNCLLHTGIVTVAAQQASCASDTRRNFSVATFDANNPSEDRWIYHKDAKWEIAGVFDGHGGWQVAEFAKNTIIPTTLKNLNTTDPLLPYAMQQSMIRSYLDVEEAYIKQIRAAYSLGFGAVANVGCCATLTVRHGQQLFVANSGDCRAVLGSHDAQNQFYARQITRDHNARTAIEQYELKKAHPNEDDIVRCKSETACYVKGYLQLTRALGDLYLKYAEFNAPPDSHRSRGRHIKQPYTPPYVQTTPDVFIVDIDKRDKFVILASDGVWDFISPDEAVDVVQQHRDATSAANAIVERALEKAAIEARMTVYDLKRLPHNMKRSYHDDTTALVVYL